MNLPTGFQKFLLLVAFLAPGVWIFREAVFTSRAFVFRDAAHYYQPLFAWAASEWGNGRLPLWNPYDNAGIPAAADPTTSAFYPGKLLFVLPVGFGARYKLYLLTHVFLAGATASFVARRWGASPIASTACGLSYAYGGSVVFQYCNAVYLVGAAWLPLAVWTIDGLIRYRRTAWVVGLGAVLAMMILGGDPQTAYHAGLVALLGLILRWRRISRHQVRPPRHKQTNAPTKPVSPALPSPALLSSVKPPPPPAGSAGLFDPTPLCEVAAQVERGSHVRWTGLLREETITDAPSCAVQRNRLLLLAAAAGMAGLFAAIQVLPAIQAAQRSYRTSFDAPRSLYELPKFLGRSDRPSGAQIAAGLLAAPTAGTHYAHVYDFSVGPWRWAEMIWPNFSGQLFPVHRRWTAAIPAEGRTWTPSLYFGLAPLIAALAAWRWRGGAWRARWMTWTVALAMVAALGWYGAGWLWLELRNALFGAHVGSSPLGGPVGGLYWFMVQLLPGYVSFRYPAKWLTVAALALSLLAAQGWDAVFAGQSLRARRVTLALLLLSLAGLAVWAAIRPYWNGWMQSVPPDALLGPLDADGAARGLLFAFLHTMALAALLLFLMRRGSQTNAQAAATLAVLLTAVDLAAAHGWIAPTAPQENWTRTSPAVAAIAADAQSAAAASFRVYRASPRGWSPPSWRQASSPQRQVDGQDWDQATLFPRYHLLTRTPLVGVSSALGAADFQAFFAVAREHGFRRPDGVTEPAPEALAVLGVSHVLLPRDAQLPGGTLAARSLGTGDLENVSLWRVSPALPRVWTVDRLVRLPELTDDAPQSLLHRTREVLFTEGRWRDFRHQAVIETNADISAITQETPLPLQPASCQLVVDTPQRQEIELDLGAPQLLVIGDYYDEDWRAYYHSTNGPTQRLPIWRTNRVLRGVWLPAGKGRLVLVYRPTLFYFGAIITAATWLLSLTWAAYAYLRPSRSHAQPSQQPRAIN